MSTGLSEAKESLLTQRQIALVQVKHRIEDKDGSSQTAATDSTKRMVSFYLVLNSVLVLKEDNLSLCEKALFFCICDSVCICKLKAFIVVSILP